MEAIDSRTKLLMCARELFYHQGFQATSVDDILRRCRVAKSNFYYHFKGKDDLAFAVIEEEFQEYQTLLEDTLCNNALSPSSRLKLYMDCICDGQAHRHRMAGCFFGNLAATLPNEDNARVERFRQEIAGIFHRIEDTLRECIAEGMRVGEMRADLFPEDMAALFLATVEGMMLLTKTHRETAKMSSGLSTLQRLLVVT